MGSLEGFNNGGSALPPNWKNLCHNPAESEIIYSHGCQNPRTERRPPFDAALRHHRIAGRPIAPLRAVDSAQHGTRCAVHPEIIDKQSKDLQKLRSLPHPFHYAFYDSAGSTPGREELQRVMAEAPSASGEVYCKLLSGFEKELGDWPSQ